VVNFFAEDGAPQKRGKHVGKQQVRNRLEPVPGCRTPFNLHSEGAQLLHQPPNLGTAGADLGSDLGAARNNRGIVHQ